MFLRVDGKHMLDISFGKKESYTDKYGSERQTDTDQLFDECFFFASNNL